MHEPEKFYGKIRKQGNSHVITIPDNIIKFAGYQEGDTLQILSKKTTR